MRPPEEYAAAHIAGAISIPLEKLKEEVASLPREKDVVAYCRGLYCGMAADAVELLRTHGFNAICVEEGVFEMS